MQIARSNSNRRGSVYLAVLGTAMIVSVLALSALALQRVQNRMLTSTADVRQAQLNAEAAIELGLLTIKNDPNWRTSQANGTWFSNRSLNEGTCTLNVVDPDSSLTDDAADPIVMTGVGAAGSAEQRVVRIVDSLAEPLECLHSSVAAGAAINLNAAVLRATNSGLISANSSTASGSTVYGRVKAVTVSGSNYVGGTTQIAAADRPAMPNWSTVFDYYRTNGTEIPLSALVATAPNLGRNVNMGGGLTDWTGTPPGLAETATLTVSIPPLFYYPANNTTSIRVTGRDNEEKAGISQRIDHFVKPGQEYYVEAYVYFVGAPVLRNFGITCYTKGTGNGSALVDPGPIWPNQSPLAFVAGWRKISATLTAKIWNGDLEYAFIKIAGSDSSNIGDFYVDEFIIREKLSGRFIYRKVLGPNVNSLGTAADPQGRYWVNMLGNRLIIERSRIKGTLLVMNPGSDSMIGPGPICWTPATPGYPALLVDADTATNADFTIAATNRALSEAEDGVNYNPAGASHETFGDDDVMNDTYPSEIQGLVLVEDDVTFQNNSLVKGSVIAGGDVTATSGSLEVIYRPDALYSPPPGLLGTWKQGSRPLSVRKVVQP